MNPVTTPDGRDLEVYVSGPDDGLPLLFHHGTPGAARPLRFLERAVHDMGLRYVCWSRPGYAGSTRQPGRRVADAAVDAATVLDALGAPECVTAGWSGGGPHALATAALLPGRVRAATVIAGVAPVDAEGLDFLGGMGEQNIEEFRLAFAGARPLRPWLEEQAPELREVDSAGVVAAMSTLLPQADVDVLTDDVGEDLATQLRHAVRDGVDGWLDDDLAFVAPWGFALDDLQVPLHLWQGTADLMVPAAHGRWLAARLPGVTAHLEDDEGHLSVGVGRAPALVAELAAHR